MVARNIALAVFVFMFKTCIKEPMFFLKKAKRSHVRGIQAAKMVIKKLGSSLSVDSIMQAFTVFFLFLHIFRCFFNFQDPRVLILNCKVCKSFSRIIFSTLLKTVNSILCRANKFLSIALGPQSLPYFVSIS